MTISSEIESNILRFHHVEKWPVGTIARQLGIHHSTVKRVLASKGTPKENILQNPSMIDPYLPFILEQLKKYPNLTASRLYHMVKHRGYPGGADHFRHLIALYRPAKTPEAYLRLRTLPAEQAQVDWGHFGHIQIGRAKRPLMAFVMVLSYSRKIFLRFFLNQQMANFLRGHVDAFHYFNGIPKVCLYDNLKSAVLERLGDAIRFHPTILDLSAHYYFEPRPVAIARGNEKGRVERAIRYIRDNFFAAREFADVDDLNQQALNWCETVVSNKVWPDDKQQTIQTAFLREQPDLITLPDNPFPTDETQVVHVGKTPYVRFDLNDYSVPHTYVRQTLHVSATLKRVSILKGATRIAEHTRVFGKAEQVEDPLHIDALVKQKSHAKVHRGQHRLTHAMSNADAFLKEAAKRYALNTVVKSLLQLLDDYGASDCEQGIAYALSKNVPHPNTVRLFLEKKRIEKNLPPVVKLDLSRHENIKHVDIKAHSLDSYCSLQNNQENNDNE